MNAERPDPGVAAAAGAATAAAVAIDGGDLPIGGGLLALVRPALDLLEPAGVLALDSSARSVREDLEAFCRLERHQYLGSTEVAGADGRPRDRHLIARGPHGAPPRSDDEPALPPMPDRADPHSGFAPRGARVEPGGPAYPFDFVTRDQVAPPEVGRLYQQAVAAQWDAGRDIPWQSVRPLPAPLERALGQVMTFLAENELSALYLPARLLPRIHPAYVETAQLLAVQLADEARHIEVFLRRARAGGGRLGISAAITAHSLHSLLLVDDVTEAELLLAVLGEGTFLDLLRFVEVHAPDEATAEIARRARADETRHVHFGMVHVRHALATDPGAADRLEAAVRRRAARLAGVGGVPAPIADALTVLAAGGTEPAAVARGHEAFRALLVEMHEAREKRVRQAGFSAERAQLLSELHTPNFM